MANPRICLIPDCSNPTKSLGLCNKHYQSSPQLGVRVRTPRGKYVTCKHPNCDKPHEARGYCTLHHYHWTRANKSAHQRKRASDGQLVAFVMLAGSATTNDCIIWPPMSARNDYLQFKMGGRPHVAHRFTCAMMHGEPTDPKLFACHSCNRRNCINPKHLRWDDARANMNDKIQHGTQQIGENGSNTKLTEDQARRAKYDLSKTAQAWADDLGVSRATISHIRNGRNWPHI